MPPVRILILDDDHALLDALPQSLQYRMYNVTVHAVDAPEAALGLLDMHDYDAVLSDVCIPRMDGLQFLAEAKRRRPSMPIVMMSGHADHRTIASVLMAGAFAYVPKPLDRDLLVTVVKRAVQVRHLTRTIDLQRRALEHCNCDAHALADTLLRQQDDAQTPLPFLTDTL
ncbi:MAG TPA: response regulator [Nitrospirales bacterium]|nr:response regulator [Nitrospirales bacterium]